MPEDVFQDHDRIVDEHSYAECQAAQAHDVHGDAGHIQQRESADHRDGDGQRDGNRITRIPQEEEEDQESQHSPEDQRGDHVVDRIRDESGLVGGHVDLEAGVLLLELRQSLPHQLRDLDRVRAGLLEDQNSDRLHPAVTGDRLALFEAVGHFSHVAEPYEAKAGGIRVPRTRAPLPPSATAGTSRLPVDHHVADLLHGLELTQRAQGVAEAPLENRPAWRAHVRLGERRRNLLEPEPVRLQQERIHLDMDFTIQPTHHLGLRHAVELLQPPPEDRLRHLLGLPQVGSPGHGQNHDGLRVGVDTKYLWAIGGLRQAVTKNVELLARVEHGEVHVGAPREVDGHQAQAVPRHR